MTDHVKIYGVKPRIQYTADGILNTYDFPFAIFSASDIDVYLGDEKQDDSAYSVSGVRSSSGGSVTLNSTPVSGTVVTIVRNLSIERSSDFQEGGALRADTLNDELDYQIACTQQIAENLNRSMVLPPYATDNDLDLTLPTPSAGKAIVWNADGTNLENSTVAVNALESTLNGYKTAAQTAATTATAQAGIAADKASVATTQAQTATTQAGIAATKATEAASFVNQLNGMRTNCITEVPQNIKLELSNGTLTLKSGSKCYLKTDTTTPGVSISSDLTATQTTNGTYFAIYNGSGLTTVLTTAYNYSTLPDTYSYPLGIITVSGGAISSIDQVFNGVGYIGSTIFAFPGVKGLIPNGRNADGTLKNSALSISSIITTTFSDSQNNVDLVLQETTFWDREQTIVKSASEIGTATGNYYIVDENRFVFSLAGALSSQNRIVIGKITTTSGVISDLQLKTVFHAVDLNDTIKYLNKVEVTSWGMPNYTAAVSKTKGTNYTAGSNGYLIGYDTYSGTSGSNNSYVYINGVNVRISPTQDDYSMNSWCYPISKGSVYSYSGDSTMAMSFVPCIGG